MIRVHGEDGGSLILALAFVVSMALIIIAILDLATTSILATERLQERRTNAYVADGTTNGAIQYLRSHPTCGRPFPNPPCPITDFRWSNSGSNGITAFTAQGGVLELDRTVNLETTVDGVSRVSARVIIRDRDPGEPKVDVLRWTYHR